MRLTGMALAGLVALAAPLAAQDFSWTGRLAAGKELEIKGVNGWVRAEAASADQIEVTARKRGRDDDPADVKVEVVEHPGGVTICAVYPTPSRSRHENSCEPGSGGRATGLGSPTFCRSLTAKRRTSASVAQASRIFSPNMTRIYTTVVVPSRALSAMAVASSSTNAKGVSNFQLKLSMWSMRMRGKEYLIHMMTQ